MEAELASNGTALAVRADAVLATTGKSAALEPSNIHDGLELAKVAASSGLFGIKSKEEAFARMATGMALGLGAWQSLRGLFVINGKVGIDASLMQGLCLSSDACEYFYMVESTPISATFAAKRKSDPKETRLSFSFADAERAGLTKNPVYKSYPQRMLEARCKAALARLVFPEKCHGLYDPEELRSLDTQSTHFEQVVEAEVAPTPVRSIETDWDDALVRHAVDLDQAVTTGDMRALKATKDRWVSVFLGAPNDVRMKAGKDLKQATKRLVELQEKLEQEPKETVGEPVE